MQFQQFTAARADTGAVLQFARVTVYLTGTTTKAALFDVGGAGVTNPFIAGSAGDVGFAVADGAYDFVIQSSDGAYTAPTLRKVQFTDFPALAAQIAGSLGSGRYTSVAAALADSGLANGKYFSVIPGASASSAEDIYTKDNSSTATLRGSIASVAALQQNAILLTTTSTGVAITAAIARAGTLFPADGANVEVSFIAAADKPTGGPSLAITGWAGPFSIVDRDGSSDLSLANIWRLGDRVTLRRMVTGEPSPGNWRLVSIVNNFADDADYAAGGQRRPLNSAQTAKVALATRKLSARLDRSAMTRPSLARACRLRMLEDCAMEIAVRPPNACYRDGYERTPQDLTTFNFVNVAGSIFTTFSNPLWALTSIATEFAGRRIEQANFDWGAVPGYGPFDTGEPASNWEPVLQFDLMTNSSGGVANGDAVVTGSVSLAGVLTVSAVTSGSIKVGAWVNAPGIAPYTVVSSFGTGTGGTGTYNLSVAPAAAMAPATVQTYGWNTLYSAPYHNFIETAAGTFNPTGTGMFYNGVALADGTNLRDMLKFGDVLYADTLTIAQVPLYKAPDGSTASTATQTYAFNQFGRTCAAITIMPINSGYGIRAGYGHIGCFRNPNRASLRKTDGNLATLLPDGTTAANPLVIGASGPSVDTNLGAIQTIYAWHTESVGHGIQMEIPANRVAFRRNSAQVGYSASNRMLLSPRPAGPKFAVETHQGVSNAVTNEGGNTLDFWVYLDGARATTA